LIFANKELAAKPDELERKVESLDS